MKKSDKKKSVVIIV